MVTVFLSLGSNIDREHNIAAALDALADSFGDLGLSSVYETEAVGFDGDPFYNMVVSIETDWDVARLSERLREIEYQQGRRRDPQAGKQFSDRSMDIDILTYGDKVGTVDGVQLPRSEILAHAFVLLPLSELAPKQRHPLTDETYDQLWRRLVDLAKQKLAPVSFRWRDRDLSKLS